MTRLSRWALLLTAGFAVLLALIITRPTPDHVYAPTFQRDPTCQQPCWHGIQLGTTTMDEAHAMLRSDQILITQIHRIRDEYIDWRFLSLSNVAAALNNYGKVGKVSALQFSVSSPTSSQGNPFTLADAVQLWGTPIGGMGYFCSLGISHYLTGELFFAGNIAVSTQNLFDRHGRLLPVTLRISPELPVGTILYYDASYLWVEDRWQQWRGFREYEVLDSLFNDC